MGWSNGWYQASDSSDIPLSYLDTDGTLAANSDSKVASQKATKTYADTKIGGTLGPTDNVVPRADGTGAKTLQASGLVVTDSGEALVGNGSASSPAHSFTGDSDTGFYRVSSNTSGFANAGQLSGGFDAVNNFQLFGNATNGGTLDLTQVTTGKTGSSTFDAFRFLDHNSVVINGPVAGTLTISCYDDTAAPKGAKTIMYRILSTGEGTTNLSSNLADQAQTSGNVPWTSTAFVADGASGAIKVQLTVPAGTTNGTYVVRFAGCYSRN